MISFVIMLLLLLCCLTCSFFSSGEPRLRFSVTFQGIKCVVLFQANPAAAGAQYDKEFIVCSLDLLSGLTEGLGSGIESLVLIQNFYFRDMKQSFSLIQYISYSWMLFSCNNIFIELSKTLISSQSNCSYLQSHFYLSIKAYFTFNLYLASKPLYFFVH